MTALAEKDMFTSQENRHDLTPPLRSENPLSASRLLTTASDPIQTLSHLVVLVAAAPIGSV